jgi:hypothetical protein
MITRPLEAPPTLYVLTIFFVKMSLSIWHVLNIRAALCNQQNLWLAEFGTHWMFKKGSTKFLMIEQWSTWWWGCWCNIKNVLDTVCKRYVRVVVKMIAIGIPANKVTTVKYFRSLWIVHKLKCDIHMPRCKEHMETTCNPQSIAAPFDSCYAVDN